MDETPPWFQSFIQGKSTAESPPGFLLPQYPRNQAVHPSTYQSHQSQIVALPRKFKISKNSIQISSTNQPILTISRPSKYSLSEDSAIVIARTGTNIVLATIKVHTMLSNDVDISMNDRKTCIKEGGSLSEHWSFVSSLGKFWWFVEEEDLETEGIGSLALTGDMDEIDFGITRGALVLRDASKNGRAIAGMAKDVLSIEMPGLSHVLVDEILVSAVGMGEVMKQRRKQEKVVKVFAKLAGAS